MSFGLFFCQTHNSYVPTCYQPPRDHFDSAYLGWKNWLCRLACCMAGLRNKTLYWGLWGLVNWGQALSQQKFCYKTWSKVFCSYSKMVHVPLSDKSIISSTGISLRGLLVNERVFGETTKPSSLVLNLIYSVWLF